MGYKKVLSSRFLEQSVAASNVLWSQASSGMVAANIANMGLAINKAVNVNHPFLQENCFLQVWMFCFGQQIPWTIRNIFVMYSDSHFKTKYWKWSFCGHSTIGRNYPQRRWVLWKLCGAKVIEEKKRSMIVEPFKVYYDGVHIPVV